MPCAIWYRLYDFVVRVPYHSDKKTYVYQFGLLLDYAGDVVGFEFAVVGALIAANMCVEKLVKCRGVIMVACMAEFVQKDELAQVLG